MSRENLCAGKNKKGLPCGNRKQDNSPFCHLHGDKPVPSISSAEQPVSAGVAVVLCSGTTRMGQSCKYKALPNGEYCAIHQKKYSSGTSTTTKTVKGGKQEDIAEFMSWEYIGADRQAFKEHQKHLLNLCSDEDLEFFALLMRKIINHNIKSETDDRTCRSFKLSDDCELILIF